MRLGKGVEWTAHICATLPLVPPDKGLSVDALADYFEVPSAYLAKQMQLLRRAGIVESVRSLCSTSCARSRGRCPLFAAPRSVRMARAA